MAAPEIFAPSNRQSSPRTPEKKVVARRSAVGDRHAFHLRERLGLMPIRVPAAGAFAVATIRTTTSKRSSRIRSILITETESRPVVSTSNFDFLADCCPTAAKGQRRMTERQIASFPKRGLSAPVKPDRAGQRPTRWQEKDIMQRLNEETPRELNALLPKLPRDTDIAAGRDGWSYPSGRQMFQQPCLFPDSQNSRKRRLRPDRDIARQ